MIDEVLSRARAGDKAAFGDLTEPFRRELQVHCYRFLGSVQDAEDLVQETLLAAWRGLDRFEGRASLRTWLYRIATNRCLNALRGKARRPSEVPASALERPGLTAQSEPAWLQPYPDVLLEDLPDRGQGPEARYQARESIELAFIATLQHLPVRQRAAMLLRDVLGFSAAEVAEMLGSSEASVKGALQRARATLHARLPARDRERAPAPNSPRERELAGRFADAVQNGDIDVLVALLTDDARLTMPPLPDQYQGRVAIGAFLRDSAARRGVSLRLAPTRANTQPAFGCYLPSPEAATARPYGLLVLTLAGDQVSAITWFWDTGIFSHFGLPEGFPA